jgi:hypothetical protein
MEEDLKQALEKITKLSEENHAILKSIKRHFLWQRVIGIFYFVLIVGPIIWSIFYLPAILKPMISQYQDLLGNGTGATGQINIQDIQKMITPEMLNKLKLNK